MKRTKTIKIQIPYENRLLIFQVHQPWRLKKYRFFNMGKDHNYLDDLLNRSIMQKVARQCYLPMNALLQVDQGEQG